MDRAHHPRAGRRGRFRAAGLQGRSGELAQVTQRDPRRRRDDSFMVADTAGAGLHVDGVEHPPRLRILPPPLEDLVVQGPERQVAKGRIAGGDVNAEPADRRVDTVSARLTDDVQQNIRGVEAIRDGPVTSRGYGRRRFPDNNLWFEHCRGVGMVTAASICLR